MTRLVTLALLPLLLCGCGGLPAPPEEEGPPQFEVRLGAGDRLDISVWGEDKLHQEVTVGPDGVVAFPLIGSVSLRGLTLDEARVELAQRLRSSVLQDPVVSIRLVEVQSSVVHVLGEVARPGSVPYVQGASALGALLAAGGPLPASAELSRGRLVRDRLGRPEAYRLDFEAILAGEEKDAWLRPGDVVYVPPRTVSRWERWWRQALPWADPLPAPTWRTGTASSR